MRCWIIGAICATMVLVSSCNCHISVCQIPSPLQIEFRGYVSVANDSLLVFYYEKSTGFTTLLRQEARLIPPSFGMDSTTSTSIWLEDGYDYRVMLQSDSNTFEVTDYLIDHNYSLKSCVPFFAVQKVAVPDCPLLSIKVNGAKTVLAENGTILVSK